jgi:hypothetical protein
MEMKSPFNNNLNFQTNDVIINPINPVNPDSKRHAAGHSISNHRLNLIVHPTPKRRIFTK